MAYDPTQKRHAKGAPMAGAWAPDSARGGAAASAVMTTTENVIRTEPVTAAWTERNVLPTPRHRKPRDVERLFEVEPEFQVVDAADTEVAFKMALPRDFEGPEREIRHYDGELYMPVLAKDIFSYRRGEKAPDYAPYPNPTDEVEGTPEQLADLISQRVRVYDDGASGVEFRREPKFGRTYESEQEARDALQREMDRYVVINGKAWRRTMEPVYTVNTFGLGGNHGGTSLSVGYRSLEEEGVVRSDTAFTLDEYEEAKAYALLVAEKRGDTDSIGHINSQKPVMENPDPNRPWRHPVAPLRVPDVPDTYDVPYDRRDSLEEHESRLRKIRSQIEKHAPEAIITDDKTGKRSLNFAVLTEGTEESYKHYARKVHELSAPDLDSF